MSTGVTCQINSNNSPTGIDDYEETLKKWKESCQSILFIYESAYYTFSRLQKLFGAMYLILSTTMSFLVIANVDGISVKVLSLTSTFISGIGQLYAIQDRSQSFLEYIKEVQHFYILLVNRDFLPLDDEEGKDAKGFVLANKDKFSSLMSSAPEIPNFIYKRLSGNYDQGNLHGRRANQLLRITR